MQRNQALKATGDEWATAIAADFSSSPDLSILDSARHVPPSIPLEPFGPWSSWLDLTAKGCAAPVDYVAGGLLASAGALIGNARWAHVWAGWVEPPILWICLVGAPSSGKSPALDPVLGHMRRLEKDLLPEWEAALSQWAGEVEAAKIRHEAWQTLVANAVKAGEDIPAKPDDVEAPEKPERPRLVVGDVNEASLCRVMQVQPKGLLITRDELSAWLGGMDRQGDGKASRPFYLEAWRGRGHTIDRVSFDNKPIVIERLSVSVLGGMQPDKLVDAVLSGPDDGLSARFLYLWPNVVPFKRPREMADSYFATRAFNKLSSLQMVHDDNGNLCPSFIPFNEGAQEILESFAAKLQSSSENETGLMAGFVGKMRANAVRLALVFEFLWWAGGDDQNEPEAISEAAINAALMLIDEYFIPMGRRSFMDAALPEEVRLAKALARWITKENVTSLNKRQLYRSGVVQGINSAPKAEAAVEFLVDAGWLAQSKRHEPSRAGRNSGTYSVNPLVFERDKP